MENRRSFDDCRDIIEKAGYPVGQGSVDCTIFKIDHPNCIGCQYELGCAKGVRLMMVAMMPMSYHPTSFADYQAMMERIHELTQLIMDAGTVEQLQGIPHI